ncbi:hypothetical protein H1C71_032721, partial [Ictidomys tridecemlineatus]
NRPRGEPRHGLAGYHRQQPMALQETTKRGKDGEGGSVPFSPTTSSQRQPRAGAWRCRRLLVARQRPLRQPSALPPTPGLQPPSPEDWRPTPEPKSCSRSPRGLPLLGLQMPCGGTPRRSLQKPGPPPACPRTGRPAPAPEAGWVGGGLALPG